MKENHRALFERLEKNTEIGEALRRVADAAIFSDRRVTVGRKRCSMLTRTVAERNGISGDSGLYASPPQRSRTERPTDA